MGMLRTDPKQRKRSRKEPKRTEQSASQKKAVMPSGLRVPSIIDETQMKLTRKNETQE